MSLPDLAKVEVTSVSKRSPLIPFKSKVYCSSFSDPGFALWMDAPAEGEMSLAGCTKMRSAVSRSATNGDME